MNYMLYADVLLYAHSWKLLSFFSVSLLIVIFGVIGLFYLFHKQRKIKPKSFNRKITESHLPTVLDKVIYDEIISLAQHNSAEFLYRFRGANPKFFEKLLQIEPNLKTSELTFCAYLKLQFSTKEIAACTFVTLKAVQNRKNRIRKKLNIPSQEDLYVWFGKF
ncbi:hypothetical protein J2X97_003761 [Epilithonimonas hungarica]|uniref:helix-turn-helix transcriptional regulator n=1 Tax=Epilithonimonas hungarica TaxID=454006 RepID=UPI00278A50E9|nr:hypothetical protein [Epilithonimonas hungarica]MDP9958087.1 hypothetical protein [Epilithonimonas hungarica]